MRIYLDTSAAKKLVWPEVETAALIAWLSGHELVANDLLEVELGRIAARNGQPLAAVTSVLARVSLAPITRGMVVTAAGFADPGLRSLDTIHLAGAISLAADVVCTYDIRLAAAAASVGIPVANPA